MNPLYLILAVVFGLALITVVIFLFSRRNGNAQTQNNGGNQPPANNGGNNQQPVGNLCDGPLPLRATVHIEAQDLPINLWLGLCNPRRFVRILLSILAGMLLILTLLFVYLAAQPANGATTAPAAGNQTVVTPAPVVNPPAPQVDLKPVTTAIDSGFAKLGNKVDAVDKNLTAHRESSKRGYKVQNEKLDKIAAGVDSNGKLLTDIQARVANIQNQIQLLLPKIDDTRSQYEAAIKSGNEELKNYWRIELQKLNDKLEELLNKKEKAKSGDPD